MANNPLVSIIIPAYNRVSMLERAIKSVLRQTFDDWELIIIDDGSTKNLEIELENYFKDSRIRIFRKENSGAADSRNRGVLKASGDYIIFLDSDDEVKEYWLEEFKKVLWSDINSLGLIFCGYEKWKNKDLLMAKLPQKLGPLVNNVTGTYLSGCYLVKKEIFSAVGGFDTDLKSGHHTELMFRIIPYCLKNNLAISSINKASVKIHVHEGERIRTNHKAIYSGTKRIFEKHGDLMDKSRIDKSNYLKIIGFHASAIGNKKEAYNYYYKSFSTKPTISGLLRLIKYRIKEYT